MTDVRLRPCASADAAVVAQLHRRCFDDGWDEVAVGAFLGTAGAFGFVALDRRDVALGVVLCRAAAEECEILTLGVAPEVRRQGIGRRLAEVALAAALTGGGRRMVLEVAEDNLAARRLYEGLGFATVGRRRAYYRRRSAPPADAVVLAKDLAAQTDSLRITSR